MTWNLVERLQLRFGEPVEVGEMKLEGWSKPLPVYGFICKRHGYVESRPYGFDGRLMCPLCKREEYEERR